MLAALFFDLDGTLADTDPLHFQAWQELLDEFGLTIDRAFYRARISGRLNPDIVAELLPALSPEESNRFIERKEGRFRALATGLEPLAGALDVLNWANGLGLKYALVSNAPSANARFMLGALKLEKAFPTMVLGEEVAAGKPDPLPYRVALDRLGVSASRSLAFEDSPSGVRSAVGAGIPTVGIATTHPPEHLIELGAKLVIPNFDDPRLWVLLRSAGALEY
ncbi:HAD family hydrolase [Gloeobacter morelensis]|uniref:HAD family phosphatase n=1 Tax=Gloeobacter morelensis MG652769 TaxID=2781736 RepID=A0ABY3PLK1_9CYAN|nr:HAD family phosphatase [Gloeobacter morelensis]UFP94479.1 HAD family phosphatase [Gloeobacter morelensis MG652769]